jgi:hypothetical protein
MVAVTLGRELGAGRLASADAGVAPVTPRKSSFVRMFDAITRSQMMRAEREILRYRHLLPPDFKLHRDLWSGREEKLPFGGW